MALETREEDNKIESRASANEKLKKQPEVKFRSSLKCRGGLVNDFDDSLKDSKKKAFHESFFFNLESWDPKTRESLN